MSSSARDSLGSLAIGAAIGIGATLIAQKASTSTDSFFGSGPSLVRKLSFKTPPCIVIIDPLSSGLTLASLLTLRGYAVIRVFSSNFPDELVNLVPKNLVRPVEWMETVYHSGDVNSTLTKIMKVSGVHVENFMVGCESGVELTDELTNLWVEKYKDKNCHVVTNGVGMSRARRDKYEMGEAVRGKGLRAAGQKLIQGSDPTAFSQLMSFVSTCEDPSGKFRVVLKPVASAGSEGVFFATNEEECRKYYDEIFGSTNVFGELNTSVLVQEFLEGKEYVVDSVSIEGIHKTVAIWEYDKRSANGAKFVYYGMRLYESETGEREDELVKYMHSVLDALEIRNGPSHGEVMWTSKGPCLVEVGSRPHGGEGTFVNLVEKPIGYSQLSVMIDAHENRHKFFNLPVRPPRLKAYAVETCLVANHEGTLHAIKGLEEVEKLQSFQEIEWKVKVGEHIPLTIDFLTSPAAIMLMHESKEVVERDFERIHEMELLDVRRVRLDTL